MQYTMLIYHDEKQFRDLPKETQNRVHAECGAWHEELVRSGHSRGATGLQPSTETKTLTENNQGEIVLLDGPFAETKEMLGGFETLECQDIAEAIAIARRFPALRAGAKVELRPGVLGNQCRAD
jgi:hypothetical protein